MKLSIIGLETTHGYIYPAMINGYDPAAMQRNALDIVSGIFPTGGAPSVDPMDTRIVACYDPDPAVGRAVAEACSIERVCPDIADAYRDVDGVIISAGDATTHLRLARPALEAGLPTFVDKPFAASAVDAETMAALAERHGAPIFCTSAIRFAEQTQLLRARLDSSVGEGLTAHVIGTGEFSSYAVHSLELLVTLWGTGVRTIQSLGRDGFDILKLEFEDGRQAIWQACTSLAWMFHIAIYGTEGYADTSVGFTDRYALFRNTAQEIVRFMTTGAAPVSVEETIDIVRILARVLEVRGLCEPQLVRG